MNHSCNPNPKFTQYSKTILGFWSHSQGGASPIQIREQRPDHQSQPEELEALLQADSASKVLP
jgi:hypothetical protein